MLKETGPYDLNKALWLAQLTQLLRSPNAAALCRSFLTQDIGYVVGDSFQPATPTQPAAYIGFNAEISVMVIDGAVNLPLAAGVWNGWRGSLFDSTTDVHNVFLQTLAAQLNTFRYNAVSISCPLDIVSGFSMGGALAHLLLGYTGTRFWPAKAQAITFGAPRSGGTWQWTDVERARICRYFNDDDFIPLLPPRISYWSSAGITIGDRAVRRFANYAHVKGGTMLGNTGSVIDAELPNVATVPDVVDLSSAFLGYENSLLAPHAITEYGRRLQLAIGRLPVAEIGTHSTAPRENVERHVTRDIRQAEQRSAAVIFNIGERQSEAPQVIPTVRLFKARRLGRVWWVYFGDQQIVAAPRRRRAQGLAAAGNDFLRRLQRQAVVDPAALGNQFAAYLELAADPTSGFSPTLNTSLVAAP